MTEPLKMPTVTKSPPCVCGHKFWDHDAVKGKPPYRCLSVGCSCTGYLRPKTEDAR